MDRVVFFKCLADATRLRILNLLLCKGELCVCDLMTATQESQPKISRHLALLRTHQILLDERRGQWVYYRLNPDLPPWAELILAQLKPSQDALSTDDLARLDNTCSVNC
ncbi:metalloregulator ArsR/SmtB family transcription factor [Nitrincola tapanii]|uniref:Metalloregulator ArsR/SmtB family transcription factor n=1 Tax=Nitrincola tapanii TaxID=1708751 RepID=A0A5A9W0Y2_9GAMM|nr:metalloregulator ArsR/SmtB family transcription factor [Nitrincola tapanii]KAA0874144.1 metalloregulator ArsR/SmtB family transcription factor [Nitrincola tapanii]